MTCCDKAHFGSPVPSSGCARGCWYLVNMGFSTTIVNKTTAQLTLFVGQNRVYRRVGILEGLPDADAVPTDKNKLQVKINGKNITYQQIKLVYSEEKKIHISSDACVDCSTIYVKRKPHTTDEFTYEVEPPKPSTFRALVSNFWHCFT